MTADPPVQPDPDGEPYFAHGTGDLSTLVPCVGCGIPTFRRRWGVAVHVKCETDGLSATHQEPMIEKQEQDC